MAAPAPMSPSPTLINIRETSAVVEGIAQDVDGRAQADADAATPCYLGLSSNASPITFSLYFDSSSNIAFFKIKATISVRDLSRGKNQTAISLFIYPEDVVSLVHDQSNTSSPEVAAVASKKLSDCRTTCLRFTLSKPASLIAPLHIPLAPKSRKDAQVLRSLHMLANTIALSVHFAHEALPTSELMARVCDAATKKTLKSSINHGDLTQLYGGQGGKVIDVDPQNWPVVRVRDEQETAVSETSAESPPSYDELVSHSLPPPQPARSSKRPRASLGYSEGGLESPDMMNICRKAVAEQIALLRGGLRAEIRREVKAQLGELEDGLMERVDQRLEDQISELREDLSGQVDSTDDRVDEVERHMDDLIDERIEDRVLGVKIDMQDFVKDEMANVEDTIIKHFEDGRISLQFER